MSTNPSAFNGLFEPVSLTEPTPEDYEDAMHRVFTAVDEQGMRDMHTAYWYGWNKGYQAAMTRKDNS